MISVTVVPSVDVDGREHRKLEIITPVNMTSEESGEYVRAVMDTMIGSMYMSGDVDIANALCELDNSDKRTLLADAFCTVLNEAVPDDE